MKSENFAWIFVFGFMFFVIGIVVNDINNYFKEKRKIQKEDYEAAIDGAVRSRLHTSFLAKDLKQLKDEFEKIQRDYVHLHLRTQEIESLIIVTPKEAKNGVNPGDFNVKVGTHKVMYQGMDILDYINSLEKEIKSVKRAIDYNVDEIEKE